MNIAIHAPINLGQKKRRNRIAIHGPDDWKHARLMILQGAFVFATAVVSVQIALAVFVQHTMNIGFFRAIYVSWNALADGFSLPALPG